MRRSNWSCTVRRVLLLAEIKNVDRRLALAQIKEQLEAAIADQLPGYIPLLVAPYMTEAMAEECRRIDLPFADAAGNLFLRTGTTLLYIVGRPATRSHAAGAAGGHSRRHEDHLRLAVQA